MDGETSVAAQVIPERAASRDDGDGQVSLRVGWVGPSPAWLERDEVRAELAGIEFERIDAGEHFARSPQVVHVAKAAVGALRELRKALPKSTFVLDLTGEEDIALGRSQVRQARGADVVFVGSRWEAGELYRRTSGLPTRIAVVGRPLDLDWFAPEARLAEAKGRGRDLRLFRRFHRLAGPVVLFAGPYTEAGGLDLLLEAVFRLRERTPELRLAAIPHGSTDRGYLDRCEMRALALGHHGIVEWEPVEAQIPFWYATAAVVCAPFREAISAEPARRAAASGRPLVGSDLESVREYVDHGATGYLLPVGDIDSLESSLEALLGERRRGEPTRRGSPPQGRSRLLVRRSGKDSPARVGEPAWGTARFSRGRSASRLTQPTPRGGG